MLAHSLRDAGTKKRLAVLVTLETLSADAITELKVRVLIAIRIDCMQVANCGIVPLRRRDTRRAHRKPQSRQHLSDG